MICGFKELVRRSSSLNACLIPCRLSKDCAVRCAWSTLPFSRQNINQDHFCYHVGCFFRYGLNSVLPSTDRNHVLSNSTCDFYNIFSNLHSSYASSLSDLRSYPAWLTIEIHKSIRVKHALQKKFRASKDDPLQDLCSTLVLLLAGPVLTRGVLKPF